MVTLERTSKKPYEFTTGLHTLGDIALVERTIPDDWISEDGWLPNQQFMDYVAPLIEGDANVPTDNGLPHFAELNKVAVDKKLPPRD